jgi:hypothetical protein
MRKVVDPAVEHAKIDATNRVFVEKLLAEINAITVRQRRAQMKRPIG